MAVQWITAADTVDPYDPFAEEAATIASWILYKLSGEKYPGIMTTTEAYSLDTYGGISYKPELISGTVHNIPSRMSSGPVRLKLRNTPVRSVQSVSIGGELVDSSAYQIRNSTYLVRASKLPWVLDPLNEIEVSYTFGTAPPKAGIMSAIRLANEIIWLETEPDKCSLPERVTSSVSRQGVSYTILDPQEFIKEGRVGITSIDLFLKAANPTGAKKKAKLFSPTNPTGERIN